METTEFTKQHEMKVMCADNPDHDGGPMFQSAAFANNGLSPTDDAGRFSDWKMARS
ncbi:MAG: hypothetical protein ABI162_17860 [Luteolibacter sp.]